MGERNTERKTRTRTENKPLSVKALKSKEKKVGLQSQKKRSVRKKTKGGFWEYMLYGTESFNQSFQKQVQYEKDERRVGWKQ